MRKSVHNEIRKRSVVDVLYTRIYYSRTVDVRDTHFEMRKWGWWTFCYKRFDIKKGFVRMVDVLYTHFKVLKS